MLSYHQISWTQHDATKIFHINQIELTLTLGQRVAPLSVLGAGPPHGSHKPVVGGARVLNDAAEVRGAVQELCCAVRQRWQLTTVHVWK